MKRFMNPALVAIAAFATFGLAACGTTTTTTDNGTDAAADSLAQDATATTDVQAADVAKDVAALPCGGTCKAGTVCNTKTNVCDALPCGGPCPTAGDKCGADNKCYTPCGGACKTGETCDQTTPPGVCKAYTAPKSWGIGGDGKVQKVVKLAISAKASSCDMVDAAGKLGASDGVGDNALAGAASLIGSNLQDAVKKGSVVLIFEPKTYKFDGTEFMFNVLIGDQDPTDVAHDPTTAGGKYTVKPESYDLTKCDATGCPSLVHFDKAAIKGGKLSAKADKFFLNLNISSISLALTISAVDFSGTAADATSWASTTGGRLCGYITETDLNSAIDALPDSLLQQFGGKDAVKKLIPSMIKSDVDSDGDGIKDAKSLSLDIDTLGGTVTGLTAPKAP